MQFVESIKSTEPGMDYLVIMIVQKATQNRFARRTGINIFHCQPIWVSGCEYRQGIYMFATFMLAIQIDGDGQHDPAISEI